MAAKVDPSSSVEPHAVQSSVPMSASSTVSTNAPKVSMFGVKSGFVIPKNKLSGSLVPIFRGSGKLEDGNVAKEEASKQVQRKTKWGPDLMLDAAVRKGRALAYQTRLEQVTDQLKSGALDSKDNQGSNSPNQDRNDDSIDNWNGNQHINPEQLELEKREIIGEILRLNPAYKAPADYKPLLKEAKVPIPFKACPGYNFIGLLLGSASNAQKRLEEETGAKVRVHGTKRDTMEKHELTQSDIHEDQGVYEELYINVSADTYEKVDSAVALVELLLTPVSGKTAVSSTIATPVVGDNVKVMVPSQKEMVSSYVAIPMVNVNQAIQQQPPGPLQFQPYAVPWYPGAPPNAPPHPSPGYMPSSVPNNSSAHFPPSPVVPFVPPYSVQPPAISLGQTSSVTFRPMQAMPQPLNQAAPHSRPGQQPLPSYPVVLPQGGSTMHPASQPISSGTMPAQLALPFNSQLVPIPPARPNRPLASPSSLGSSGWSQVVPPTQIPLQPPLSIPAMRPSTQNMPVNVVGRPLAVISPSIVPTNVASRPATNFALAALPSRHSNPPPFPSIPPQTVSMPAMVPSSSVTLMRANLPSSMPVPLHIPSPSPRPLPSPGQAPGAAPSSIPGPASMPGPPSAVLGASNPVLAQASGSSHPMATAMELPPGPVPLLGPAQSPRSAQPSVPLPQRLTSTPISNPGSIPSFSPLAPATSTVSTAPSITALRPPRPLSGDFTFHPVRAQVLASQTPPAPNSQSVQQITVPLAAPQTPSFRLTVQNPAPSINTQVLPRPLAVNQTIPSQASFRPLLSSAAAFAVSPAGVQPRPIVPDFPDVTSVRLMAPTTQMVPPSFSSASQVPNLPGSLPSQSGNFMQPRHNQLPPTNRPSNIMIPGQQLGVNPPGHLAGKVFSSPGGNQIYDPFSPTSFVSAPRNPGNDMKVRKEDTDAEYEDLMASVGVK